MPENTPILWMRKKPFLNRKPDLYHVQRDNNPDQMTHYFYTLCHKEIKGMYREWDITKNPEEKKCCSECLALVKSGTPRGGN
jgi:hypothetical protein